MRRDAHARRVLTRRTLLKGLAAGAGAMGVGVLGACSKSSPPAKRSANAATQAAQTAKPASGTPVRGGQAVQPVANDITSLQPIIAFDSISGAAWGKFYLGLLRSNPDTGVLEPDLAEKFDVSADGLTGTFTLRDGLTWSDGVPFTGNDYKYTVEAIARSKKTFLTSLVRFVAGGTDYAAGKTDSISGISVSSDGKTITVQRAAPLCFGWEVIGLTPAGVLPMHHFVKTWDNKTTDTSKNIDDSPLNQAPPASMGPFVFKDRQPGVQISMTRNDHYFRGAPLLDGYIVKVYANTAAVKAALLSGEATFGGASPQDVDELKQNQSLSFIRLQRIDDNFFIGWNQKAPKAPWLAVKEVRQALWYGLNVKEIIDKLILGYGTQSYTHMHPSLWAYDGTGLNHYAFDPAKAKQLLETAGAKMGSDGVYRWTDGQPMQMRIDGATGGGPLASAVQVAQQQYQAIGITITPNLMPLPALLARTDPTVLDREGTIWSWSPGGSDGEPVYPFYHSDQIQQGQLNNWHYANPAADKAMEAARNGPDCSQAARKQGYGTFGRLLNEDAANTYIYVPDVLSFSNKSLQGYQPKTWSSQSQWNVEKWWIKKA
jgi:peptide/nickel transport system substrate-binding protein